MKAILMIDKPENCKCCPCFNFEDYMCALIYYASPSERPSDCPLISLTEYEEARINEIVKEREDGTQQD